MYRRYKDGFLPEEGSIGHQPALLVDAFDEISFISGLLDEQDFERRKNNSDGNGEGRDTED